jgi:hypothetical protein
MGLNIDQNTAKRLYVESPDWFKKQLEDEFGQDMFKPKDFESIRTFEDACAKIGIDPGKVFDGSETSDEIAYKKLKIITAAINQGWKPNWNDVDQRKWYPWFNLSSGFGFDDSYYDFVHSFAGSGSRLCFESEEKSTYAGTQFIDLYEQFITIKD